MVSFARPGRQAAKLWQASNFLRKQAATEGVAYQQAGHRIDRLIG